MAPSFDMEEYLRRVGLKDLDQTTAKPDFSLLKTLVTHHVTHVVYQNYDYFSELQEVDMNPVALLDRLLVQRRGGMCLESSELLLYVLKQFHFDARRVEVFCLIDGEVYDGGMDDHQILIVHLGDLKYLVDVAMSYNSIREPIEFRFDRNEEKILNAVESYYLEVLEDHYILKTKRRGSYIPMYRFKRPLTYLDEEQFLTCYRDITDAYRAGVKGPVNLIKVGLVTDTGRIGFKLDRTSSESEKRYTILSSENHEPVKIERVSREKFKEAIEAIVTLKEKNIKI